MAIFRNALIAFAVSVFVFSSTMAQTAPGTFRLEFTNAPTVMKENRGQQMTGKIVYVGTQPSGSLFKLDWNLGNGQTLTASTPFIVYAKAGTYTLTGTATRYTVRAGVTTVTGTTSTSTKIVVEKATATTPTPPSTTPTTPTPVTAGLNNPPIKVTTPNLPLVQAGNLSYLGAFRVPAGVTFEYNAGTAITMNGDNLLINCRHQNQFIAEISIPELSSSAVMKDLKVAKLLQPCADPIAGSKNVAGYYGLDGNPIPNGYRIGGMLVKDGKIYINKYVYYDVVPLQTASLFMKANTTLAEPNAVGVMEISPQGMETRRGRAGFVSGAIVPIPSVWQPVFGGDVLSGNNTIPGNARTSSGPSAFAWNLKDVGKTGLIKANSLLYYPIEHPTIGPSLGKKPDNVNNFWNMSPGGYAGGMVFPEGFSSVLYFGSQGYTDSCYGAGTLDASLHQKTVGTSRFCYDPTFPQTKGYHAWPYQYQIMAYDAKDLAEAKVKNRNPWDIKPYAVWPLKGMLGINGTSNVLSSATYDPASKRVYFAAANIENKMLPVIYVFQIK